MDSPLLSIQNLKTYFFTNLGIARAVDGLDLTLPRGTVLGIVGESGCGKSVTALSILRLIPQPPGKIEAGKILFEGQDLLELEEKEMRKIRGNRISMIFQEPMTSLNPVLNVGDQISETIRLHQGVSRKEAFEKAVEMLDVVKIPSPRKRAGQYPHQMSGGMRQRVMIAMAMACRPKLLIADEPTTALDVTIQAQILDLMLGLQEELGMAIMMITHDLGVIAEVSDRVVVMYAGEVMEYSSIDTLFTVPCHPYTIGLMASIPKLGIKFSRGKQPLREIPGIVPNLIRLPAGCLFAPRCEKVMDRCREQRPPLFSLGEDHGARCWLVEKGSPRFWYPRG